MSNETVREVCAEIDNEHYPTLRDEGGYEYFVGDCIPKKIEAKMIYFMDDLLKGINGHRSFDFAIESFNRLAKAVKESEGANE